MGCIKILRFTSKIHTHLFSLIPSQYEISVRGK
jgi:hypothetical protein